jgi:glycosyltransferase involved in cell wall biosynthesis
MKILFVSSTNEFGGAERHLLDLIRRIREPGVQLSILCLGDDFFTERLDPSQAVRVISWKKIPKSLWDWLDLFRIFRTDAVVFIYSWFWCLPPIASVGAYLAGIPRRYMIQHLIAPRLEVDALLLEQLTWQRLARDEVRGWLDLDPRLVHVPPGPLSGTRRAVTPKELIAEQPLCVIASASSPTGLKMSAYACNETICVSDALRDSLERDFGFPPKKLRTIHNGVSLSDFKPSTENGARMRAKLGFGPDDFVLVCAARLSEQKGIDVLLQAMAKVLHDGVDCKCVIVGDGPLRDQLLEQAEELGLSGQVFFEGFQEEVRPYLQGGSAFILTSRREGLPLSILEAMACGLPSIVTDVGGNSELITNKVHGLVVPQGSVSAIADAISYLVSHPKERLQMAKKARERACEEFDMDNTMAEIKRMILS